MQIICISANSQAQIQIAFKCFRCGIPVTLNYPILTLRDWAEQLDGVTTSLRQTTEEKNADDAFLREMKIEP